MSGQGTTASKLRMEWYFIVIYMVVRMAVDVELAMLLQFSIITYKRLNLISRNPALVSQVDRSNFRFWMEFVCIHNYKFAPFSATFRDGCCVPKKRRPRDRARVCVDDDEDHSVLEPSLAFG